eukprot:TRINITY_DN2051_c2_g2_i2.p1 TRINITY_DN2051_c2_g2~~TRINITY_DN2051_c2_g2_i2.p1  ORF type:complete len:1026 (+),score=307.52 TRINITY_DN2051_c2_g2_i2:132-3080(+)
MATSPPPASGAGRPVQQEEAPWPCSCYSIPAGSPTAPQLFAESAPRSSPESGSVPPVGSSDAGVEQQHAAADRPGSMPPSSSASVPPADSEAALVEGAAAAAVRAVEEADDEDDNAGEAAAAAAAAAAALVPSTLSTATRRREVGSGRRAAGDSGSPAPESRSKGRGRVRPAPRHSTMLPPVSGACVRPVADADWSALSAPTSCKIAEAIAAHCEPGELQRWAEECVAQHLRAEDYGDVEWCNEHCDAGQPFDVSCRDKDSGSPLEVQVRGYCAFPTELAFSRSEMDYAIKHRTSFRLYVVTGIGRQEVLLWRLTSPFDYLALQYSCFDFPIEKPTPREDAPPQPLSPEADPVEELPTQPSPPAAPAAGADQPLLSVGRSELIDSCANGAKAPSPQVPEQQPQQSTTRAPRWEPATHHRGVAPQMPPQIHHDVRQPHGYTGWPQFPCQAQQGGFAEQHAFQQPHLMPGWNSHPLQQQQQQQHRQQRQFADPQRHGGDVWLCACGFRNSSRNVKCGGVGPLGCKKPRSGESGPTATGVLPPPQPPHPRPDPHSPSSQASEGEQWMCRCGFVNSPANQRCGGLGSLGCKASKPAAWRCRCGAECGAADVTCKACGVQQTRSTDRWKCGCGFLNSWTNAICGGTGPLGCKRARRTTAVLSGAMTAARKTAGRGGTPQLWDLSSGLRFLCSQNRHDAQCITALQLNVLDSTQAVHSGTDFDLVPTEVGDVVVRLQQLQPLLGAGADVVCLQELRNVAEGLRHGHAIRSMLSELGYQWRFNKQSLVAWQRNRLSLVDSQPLTHGIAVTLKSVPAEGGEPAAAVGVTVCSTHQPYISAADEGEAAEGGPRTREDCDALQRTNAESLCEELKHQDGAPLLILGDFNAQPSSPVYSFLQSRGLVSAYSTRPAGEPAVTTVKPGGDRFAGCIDYIWGRDVSFIGVLEPLPDEAACRAEHGGLPSSWCPSDHLPLAAAVRLPTVDEAAAAAD